VGGFLESLLRVERTGDRTFVATLHDYGDGVSYGGDALGRAALAASLTRDDAKFLHALHASFVRPLPAGVPVDVRVEPLSDGRRLARRRVEIHSGGVLCFEATASLSAVRDGVAWQDAAPPDVPGPESLPDDAEVARAEGWTDWKLDEEEFAWRFVGRPFDATESPGETQWSVWMRPRVALPDDPRVHAAAVAFLSDYSSHWSAARRLGRALGPREFVSLDQMLHLHRPARWDDWWLSHAWSDVAHAGRTLWQRRLFDRSGALVASVRQEGMLTSA
jgi:acyl-CoA thioesterase-2